MNISLDSLLQTGSFGDLRFGMSKYEVQESIGAPDYVGNTSRKYPRPSIFLYGNVELWFRRQAPEDLIGFYWEPGSTGALRLPPTCQIQDWEFVPEMTFSEVQDYLLARDLPFEIAPPISADSSPSLILASGVRVSFDDEARLGSLSSALK